MLTNSKRGYDHSSKQAIGFEKPFCLKKRIVVPDSDETLELSEKSRSKMLLKEQDPLMPLIGFVQTVVNFSENASDEMCMNGQQCLNMRLSCPKKKDFVDKELMNKLMICMSSDNLCVSNSLNDVKSRAKSKKRKSKKDSWKPTGKVFTQIGYIWKPTGRTFTIVGNACPLTRITTTNEVPSRKPIVLDSESPKPVVKLVYSRKPRKNKTAESVSKTKALQPMSANKKEPSKSWGSTNTNIPSTSLNERRLSKLSSVKFGNDQVAKIMGFGDYQIGNVTISRVYYVEGLGHNLFSVGQFCDSNLEVAFRQHTCFIRNLEGVDLLTGSRGDNLYTLSLGNYEGILSHLSIVKASKPSLLVMARLFSFETLVLSIIGKQ
ncbi:hypothetical protein Tco_0121459 [Tanacetum coccineum]